MSAAGNGVLGCRLATDRRCWKYWISNLKGKSNGYCYLEHIYGRLFQVIH